MRVTRGKASVISDVTIDEDLDFLTLYQAKRLASPASGEALRKGNKDIGNAEIADAANIAISKLVDDYLPEVLLTTQGDLLIRGASLPERLAKITTGQFVKATTTGYEGVANPATKETWFPATQGTELWSQYGLIGGGRCNADTEFSSVSFRVPLDFTSIVAAVLVIRPMATDSTMDWDIKSCYAANGEAYSTHQEEDASTTYDATNDQLIEVDVSGILANLAAGDSGEVHIKMETAGDDFLLLGMKLKYA